MASGDARASAGPGGGARRPRAGPVRLGARPKPQRSWTPVRDGARLHGLPRQHGRHELRTAELARFAKCFSSSAFLEFEQDLLVLIDAEGGVAILVVDDDMAFLRQESIEEAFARLADEFLLLDLEEEDLDEGVGHFDEDDAIDHEIEVGRTEVGEVPEAFFLAMIFFDAAAAAVGLPHLEGVIEATGGGESPVAGLAIGVVVAYQQHADGDGAGIPDLSGLDVGVLDSHETVGGGCGRLGGEGLTALLFA